MAASGARGGIAIAAMLLVVAGCDGTADKAGGTRPGGTRTLRVLNVRAYGDLAPIAERVEELSHGTLKLAGDALWGQDSVTAEVEAIREVRAGTFDLAIIPARAWHEAGVTSFDAFIAPMAVDSVALQDRVLASELPAEMLAGVTSSGLDGIAILPGPMRKPAGITRPLLGPSSYAGASIAYNRSAIADRSLRQLGATAAALPRDGAGIAGRDGMEVQVPVVAQSEYDGMVRSITANVDLWPRPLVLVANHRTFRGLPAEQAGWLRAAAADTRPTRLQALMQEDNDSRAILCRRAGLELIEATPAQIGALRYAFRPVHDWLRQDPATARMLDRIAALRRDVQPYPQETLSCGDSPATAPARVATPFDGTYRMEMDEQFWLKDDPEKNPGNWGSFAFVFSRGRFVFTQENRLTCSWQYGTYEVDGQTVVWDFLDGGGTGPSRVHNHLGERFTHHWSRYRDTMTLVGIDPPSVKWSLPWHRVSVAPRTTVLSKRCPPPPKAIAW
ncbi:hypothetical protein [Paractinoplanes globisporus]|uniref:Uncharacterized protein n=1 Tax=Paractinoplanes globisporus TaxID=113565 RepID=A0ABW6W4X9_9ACTN|nr:hypothetical protein [Actinoplanes globisporus]